MAWSPCTALGWIMVQAWCLATAAATIRVNLNREARCHWVMLNACVPLSPPLSLPWHCFAAFALFCEAQLLHYFGAMARSMSLWAHYWSQRRQRGWFEYTRGNMLNMHTMHRTYYTWFEWKAMHTMHIGHNMHKRGNMQWQRCRARSYLDREEDRGGGSGPTSVSWVLHRVECYTGGFLVGCYTELGVIQGVF